MNFSLFEDNIITYRMADKSSYYYLSYHVKADTVHEVNLYVHGCGRPWSVWCAPKVCAEHSHLFFDNGPQAAVHVVQSQLHGGQDPSTDVSKPLANWQARECPFKCHTQW